MEYGKSSKKILAKQMKHNHIIIFLLILWAQSAHASTDDEILISSKNDDCSYVKYNSTTFGYPKIIKRNDDIYIYYPDARKNHIIEKKISNNKITQTSLIIEGKSINLDLPVANKKNNKIVICGISRKNKENNCNLFFKKYENTEEDWELTKELQINLCDKLSKKHHIKRIFQSEKTKLPFLATGYYSETYFKPIAMLSGEHPRFLKNFSIAFGEDEAQEINLIEEKGQFGGNDSYIYEQDESGNFYSSWVRTNKDIAINKKEWFEEVCVSVKKTDSKWVAPKIIYKTTDEIFKEKIKNLSFVSEENNIFLTWEDVEKGIFFAKINESQINPIIVSDNSQSLTYENKYEIPLLWKMRTSCIYSTAKKNNSIYIIWARNTGLVYCVYLSIVKNGICSGPIAISEGVGVLMLPDFVVDEQEVVHITYMKKYENHWGCYYKKIPIRNL